MGAGVDVVADLFADGAAVHINGLHAARVERLADGAANALHQEQNTGDLETAARVACAGADEHGVRIFFCVMPRRFMR